MKEWTKAMRAEASRQSKARWLARKKRDTRTAQSANTTAWELATPKKENSVWTSQPMSPADEIASLAAQLGKERAWRSSVAAQLISVANELLQS